MGLLGISTDIYHCHGNLGETWHPQPGLEPSAHLEVGAPGCGRRATNFLDAAAHGVPLGPPLFIRRGGARFLWGLEPGAQKFGLAKSSFHADDKVVDLALHGRTKAWATNFSEDRSVSGDTVPSQGKRGTRTAFRKGDEEVEDEDALEHEGDEEDEHHDEDGELNSNVDPKKKLTPEECDELKQRERELREEAIDREDHAEKEMEDAMVRTAKGTEENHKTGVSNRETEKVANDMEKITQDTDTAEKDMSEEMQLHAQWKASCSGKGAKKVSEEGDGGASGDQKEDEEEEM